MEEKEDMKEKWRNGDRGGEPQWWGTATQEISGGEGRKLKERNVG